jgi:hypothetical protein
MAKYVFSGLPTHFVVRNGEIVEQNVLVIEARKTVDVNSMVGLQAEFDAYCAELSGKGKQCYRVDATAMSGVRAFPGFKKATQKNGSLNRVVNREEAVAKAKVNCHV